MNICTKGSVRLTFSVDFPDIRVQNELSSVKGERAGRLSSGRTSCRIPQAQRSNTRRG